MIDAKEYNLIYFCRETKKQVSARRLGDGQMSVIENGEAVSYTPHTLKRKYKASKANSRAWMKPIHARPGSLNKLYYSKKFRDYLDESSTAS